MFWNEVAKQQTPAASAGTSAEQQLQYASDNNLKCSRGRACIFRRKLLQ